MKTHSLRTWTAVGLSLLTTAALTLQAEEAVVTQPQKTTEKTYTGTVKSVDAKDRAVTVKRITGSKRFNLGDSCVFDLVDKHASSIDGVRAGQKVTLTYQDANGVLVADRLAQVPLLYTGTVKSVDTAKHTLTVGKETYRIADDCAVVLHNNRAGSLADVEPGHTVTVLHEDADNGAVARQIAQTSQTFTGSLTAIDLTERTLKARTTFASKRFNVADDCTIVVDGKPATLSNLKPGDKLEFTYDEVKGVNVVNRIAPGNAPAETATAQNR